MADGPSPKLPVLAAWLGGGSGPPTLDEARETLGGPWRAARDVGEAVTIDGRVGVVVHGFEDERDVWIGAGRIQRVGVERLEAAEADGALAEVADDALVFATLAEGAEITFLRRDHASEDGKLLEKLRYGALVGLADGRVLAVSFRRISPRGVDDA